VPDLSLGQLAEATGGTLLRGKPETLLSSFVINTRVVKPGGAFFALTGSRSDGHRFLRDAVRRGAAAAVIARDLAEDAAAPPGLIRVDDTAVALANCGRWLRKNLLASAKWYAVTGSNGKTTTKELLAEGLSAFGKVHRTHGNLNNHLGVPLTLLACPEDAEMVVVELAMSAAGEIAELAQMTDPDFGLVTNVRAVHLEYFNSLDDIAAAKGELFGVMRDDATPVVNLDDLHVRVQAARHHGNRVTFGQHPDADVHLEELENRFVPGAGLAVRQGEDIHRIQLRLGGAHSAFNALAALAAINAGGFDLEPAIRRMELLEPGAGRGKVTELAGDMILVDDCYNSSPTALASVLETVKLSQPQGRKVLVMGDMLELGPMEGALHRESGKRSAAAGVEMLVTVGALSRQCAESARRAGVPEVHQHPDSAQCAEQLGEYLREGDLIVIKGSRSMRMEKIVDALIEAFGLPAPGED
jgi:UDP-N-acetylmuramoyl-tripeptide--D-alanyl-D-alanine ligase